VVTLRPPARPPATRARPHPTLQEADKKAGILPFSYSKAAQAGAVYSFSFNITASCKANANDNSAISYDSALLDMPVAWPSTPSGWFGSLSDLVSRLRPGRKDR